MAQTTGAMTGATGKIEITLNAGSTWTDISGTTSSIDVVEFTRTNGSAYTFAGDYALLTFGKQPPVSVTVNCLYTETTAEALKLTVAAIKANTAAQIRWQAVDAAATTYLQYFTVAGGKISTVSLPGNDASSGDPLMFSFTLTAPGIDYTAVVP